MKALLLFLLLLASASARSLPVPGMPPYQPPKPVDRPQRTIHWGPWCARVNTHFRFRTGSRYAGGGTWEHYLFFEEHPGWPATIRFDLIHLGPLHCPGATLSPASRLSITKITGQSKSPGLWSWTAPGRISMIEIHQVASDLWEVLVDGEFLSGADSQSEAEEIAQEERSRRGERP